MNTTDDIYSIAVQAADDGQWVDVSLIERSLAIDGRPLIASGSHDLPLGIAATDEATALRMLEEAFAAYERSVPEHSARDKSRWFHACDEDEMSGEELVGGDDRPVARCRLEVTMLACILNGSLTKHGDQMQGKWFWQSEKHRQLVVLAEWLDD